MSYSEYNWGQSGGPFRQRTEQPTTHQRLDNEHGKQKDRAGGSLKLIEWNWKRSNITKQSLRI